MGSLHWMEWVRAQAANISADLRWPASLAPTLLVTTTTRHTRSSAAMTSLISAVGWIPRGAAAQHPTKYQVTEEELERVGKLAQVRLEDAQMELELAQATEGGDGLGEEEQDEAGDEEEEEWQESVLFTFRRHRSRAVHLRAGAASLTKSLVLVYSVYPSLSQ